MAVELINVRPANKRTVERICSDAMRALGYDGPLRVRVVGTIPDARPGIEASGGDGEVIITSRLLTGRTMRLRSILFEEIAHAYLGSLGVGHSGVVDRFYQELFSTWFAFRDAQGKRQFDRRPAIRRIAWRTWATPSLENRARYWNKVTTTPVPNDTDRGWLAYDLGKHVAGVLVGSPENRRHLEDWFQEETAHRDIESMVKSALQALDGITHPAQMATAVVNEWRLFN